MGANSVISADVRCMHLLPRSVQHTLSTTRNLKVEGSSGYCWAQDGQNIYLWAYKDGQEARLKRLSLPEDPAGSVWLHILTHPANQVITAVACTLDGLLCVWFDINQIAEPVCQRVLLATDEDGIAVYAFAASPSSTGATPGFVASLAAADGSLHFIQGAPGQQLTIRQLPTSPQLAPAQASVFGTIATVLKSAYAEAFDPYKQYNRSTPSHGAALQLAIIPAGTFKWKLFVLTAETLDCWLISFGIRSAEQLLWSHMLLSAAQHALNTEHVHLLAMHLPANGSSVHIWTLQPPVAPRPGSRSHQQQGPLYALLQCSLQGDVVPFTWEVDRFRLDQPTQQPSPETAPLCNMLLDGTQQRGLLDFPSGAVYEWEVGRGVARQLVEAGDTVAVGSSGPEGGSQGSWLILCASYGVLEIGVEEEGDEGEPRGEAMADGAEELSVEQKQQVQRVLEAAVVQASRGGAPVRLGRRLQALGVLRNPENMAQLQVYAEQLVDAVPKHWASEGGTLGSLGVSVGTQLEEKGQQLYSFLKALEAAQVLPALLQYNPAVLRAIWDAAEKLAAVTAVWQLQFWQEAGLHQTPPEGSQLVAEVVEGAGHATQASRFRQLKSWEVFYAAPTQSAPVFFQAVEQTAAGLLVALQDQRMDGREGLESLRHLDAVVSVATSAVNVRRDQLQAEFPAVSRQLGVSTRQASWMVGPEVRDALERLFQVADVLRAPQHRQRIRGEGDAMRVHLTFELADAVLDANNTALDGAALDDGAARGALAAKLAALRSLCLPPLLDETQMALAAADGRSEEEEEYSQFGMELLRDVVRMAEVYVCHEVMFDAEELLQRTDGSGMAMRVTHMRHVGAPKGAQPSDTYMRYAFQRLLDVNRHVELLELAAEFQAELLAFLGPHPRLLQRLLRLLGHNDAAAQCLLEVANNTLDLQQRMQYIQYARLAALATLPQSAARCMLLPAADDAKRLVEIQVQLGLQQQAPLQPLHLVDYALSQPTTTEAADGWSPGALAVAVLAMQPAEAVEDIRTRWEVAWRHTAADTGSDLPAPQPEETVEGQLQRVPVFRAASACVGRAVFGQVAGLVDDGPVREVREWLDGWCGEEEAKRKVVLDAFELAVGDVAAAAEGDFMEG